MTETVYVCRDESGRIISISNQKSESISEVASINQPDVVEFLGTLVPDETGFQASDLGLIRVLEDLIDVLIDKDVINFTDLPEAARDKLMKRRTLRVGLDLLTEAEDEII